MMSLVSYYCTNQWSDYIWIACVDWCPFKQGDTNELEKFICI